MATATDFNTALARVLSYEGGYVNNPADPGGATNYGVTQKVFDAWRAAHGQPATSVRNITAADVKSIYFRNYWLASGADKLPMPLALVHFDAAVNTGVGQAGRFLAKADGDSTRYLAIRRDFYKDLAVSKPALAQFLPGWLKRVQSLAASPIGISVGLVLVIIGMVWLAQRPGRG